MHIRLRPRPLEIFTFLLVLAAGLIALAAYRTYAPNALGPAAETASGQKPNIVLILTDDLDLDSMSQLPGLKATMTDQGTTFVNDFVSLSLCCPSRATTLMGEYAHDTNIFGNNPPIGGFQKFHDNGDETSTIGTWMQGAGYATALMGKYLNGYPAKESTSFVPPGWSEWDVPAVGNAYAEYNYSLNENGDLVAYGDTPDDYMTTVLDKKATSFIAASANEKKPFFLYLATYAPHQPATPPPAYADAFPGVTAPRPASYDEADLTDKPSWLKAAPLLTQKQENGMDALYRRRLQTMLSVQDLVNDVVAQLQASGQLDNTYIVFTSDNGFHLGQHRLISGKNSEFDTDLHVPLIVRGPGVAAGKTVSQITANVDLAPTFAAMAGIAIPDSVDGRSLLPLLSGDPPTSWRQGLLLEHAGAESGVVTGNADGSGLDEPPDAPAGTNNTNKVPVFAGVRTAKYTYIRYDDGEQELYDDVNDPNQLANLASTADKNLLAAFSAWTSSLAACQGETCRTIESQLPDGL